MAKSKNYDYIVALMQHGNMFSPIYQAQVEQAAHTMDEIERMRKIVKREGELLTKETQKGTETIANPLLVIINQYQNTLLKQYASLGLNRLKVDAPNNNNNNLNNFLQDLDK